jgi:hypothetical protein
MTFVKGNKLGALGKGVKKGKYALWYNGGEKFLMEFSSHYHELLDKVRNGEKLSEADKEFCDRYEKQQEFYQPKLQRTEITGKDGEDLIPKEININFSK